MPVRLATASDVSTIRTMLRTHAETEGGSEFAAVSNDELDHTLGGPNPTVRVTLVTLADEPNRIAGLAMWYPTFSSWSLRSGIWLEDLFVDDAYRGAGLGVELMTDLRARTNGRIEWDVSGGNDGAERFYERLGAARLPGWTRYRWMPSEQAAAVPG